MNQSYNQNLSNNQPYHQQYQEQYDQPHNQHISDSKKQYQVENFISLKKRQQLIQDEKQEKEHLQIQLHVHNHKKLSDSQEKQKNPQMTYEQKQNLIKKLKLQLASKTDQVKKIKKDVADKKKKIRQIGNQVDREMNKSLFRQNKFTPVVNIHHIFHTNQMETNNPKIKQLQQQLNKLRAGIKKQKQQNKKHNSSFSDPINNANHQKYIQLEIKNKEKQIKIKEIQQQRDFMSKQINLLKKDIPQDFDIDYQGDLKKTKQQGIQIFIKIKQQRQLIYDLDRQDIAATEKMCYIKQIIQFISRKKHDTLDPSEKQHIQKDIKNMSVSIREAMDQKFKTQNERSGMVKLLSQQVKNYEKKNWQLIQTLRQIDSYLLRFYSAKLRDPRNSVKKREKERAQKSAIYTFKQRDELFQNNDKNFDSTQVKIDPVMVQKRKHFEIGMISADQSSIVMNDQFLGLKNNLFKVCIVCDKSYIYGIHGQYLTDKEIQITGLNMLSRIRPKQLETKSLILKKQKGQLLQKMNIGLSKQGFIKYFSLETTQNNKIEWGQLQQSDTNETKIIRKYEGICLKSKLVQIGQKFGPNSYCLGGLGFSVVYFGIK